jgi:hypothetical protein
MAAPKTLRERQLAIVTSLALSNCLLVAFVSGVGLALANALGWPIGAVAWLHQASSYVLLGLAALHVYLYRRTLVGQVRKWIIGETAPGTSMKPMGRSHGAPLHEREAQGVRVGGPAPGSRSPLYE